MCSKPSKLLVFSWLPGLQVASRLLNNLTKWKNFNCIPVIFQHSLLAHCIPLVKDQSSFYETRSLAIYININVFHRVNRKQLNIAKAFLKYLEFHLVAYWGRFSPKSCLINYVLRVSCLKEVCFGVLTVLIKFINGCNHGTIIAITNYYIASISLVYCWYTVFICKWTGNSIY